MDIEVCSIPNCPNCKHLKMLMKSRGIPFKETAYDPDSDDDVAEMSFRGIYNAQYPVVIVDGEKMPAMTVSGYMGIFLKLKERGSL